MEETETQRTCIIHIGGDGSSTGSIKQIDDNI